VALAAVREAGKVEIVDAGAEVAPGIRMVHAPGHTPGNVVVEIRSEGASAVFLGDTFHHPGQIADPDLVSINDHARDLVPHTRRAIIERAIASSALIAAAHFAYPSVGRLAGTAEHATFVALTDDTIAG
jgi:glyoxylase-like metal-dependent hydrolase (beta-lactamase superfamily II)